jgi:rhodanese-related sulfurtransferase
MRRRNSVLSLVFMLTAFPCLAEVTDVDSPQLERLLAEGVTVVDVRTPQELRATGVVKGSHVITFYQGRGRYDMDAWVGKLREITGPDKPVILICGTGTLSVGLAEYLDKRAGYTAVYNVRDGIKRWIADGHPTVPPQLDP